MSEPSSGSAHWKAWLVRPAASSTAKRLALFAAGMTVQAAFGVLALLATRLGFRWWPAGSYTWVAALVAVAGALVTVFLCRGLAAAGLPVPLVLMAWYAGRIAGALASAVFAGVGFDAALIARASFGLLLIDRGRLALGAPALGELVPALAFAVFGCWWGVRARGRREQ
ncbi:MAG: hypothetical protein N3B11_03470 [Coriobacteriia bacterium]|nr:hypothetical protein [Coriobacteriia bacterium]